ncbi:MAG: DUF2292 domain-containing protein [Candidatus Brocadia sp. AMX2]|uniref:Uncharacterized small protein n=1 Tax=Candidatus Brocadia sinica JPN1 TaxID=1197129 RepID=A0ABQ0JYV3_9BACT|nr:MULTISPECIES: YezD family protein [Brocadia]KXK27946.1 MAG: hypothetical protein UZ01_02917 [Candidatus Brocadia sinica]MBC6932225.1 DUF2292 domain-containing protein [Candidatus Brocadia sp.]MBL1168497.1 DUF2292 domain-containing protein [Candidatus Brocadia sp. AMX1]NOG40218.1 YezD family protein [Planctomycetota bacterium]KAA0243665.1 MAG: DUF2292 domain-containing protein [Candidatus Brocadia sp. AMX2]
MEENLTNSKKIDEAITTQILKALKGIQYGYVQITIQDSKVVQIDKTEKFRLDGLKSSKPKGCDNG